MAEQEEFFSPSHDRLLTIAVWAKYLAWVVLVIHILWAIGIYFQEQSYFLLSQDMGGFNQDVRDFADVLKQFPSYGFSIVIEMIGIFLRGIMYLLVLKGISLGLNMIVETNINYGEQEGSVK